MFTDTRRERERDVYNYIYIYLCVCMCVCCCVSFHILSLPLLEEFCDSKCMGRVSSEAVMFDHIMVSQLCTIYDMDL